MNDPILGLAKSPVQAERVSDNEAGQRRGNALALDTRRYA
jgi:hypothetical protein